MTGKTAGDAFIEKLAANGVDYLFANGGTDFAPIIEALARRQSEGHNSPQALPIPHETVALGMAHGYTLATGRPQAVMVHTNVGLANVIMGAINAASEQIPILICSGATPVTETGRLGSRTTPINWGQDMKDQSALIRESVKWNTTLAYAEQMGSLVERGLAIAMSEPKGPVYLSLPREPLCQTIDPAAEQPAGPLAPVQMAPHPDAVAAAAAILSSAQKPMIVAHRSFEAGQETGALQAFAEEFAIPVVEFWPSRISLDSESPMHAGFNSGPDVAEADAILVLNALTPWIPVKQAPGPDCKVIQAGPDPLQARFPIRGFRSDVSLGGGTLSILSALGASLRTSWTGGKRPAALDARFKSLSERNAQRRQARLASARRSGMPMSMEYVSWCVGEALGTDGVIVNELGVDAGSLPRTRPGSIFSHAVSGGLGWGLPAALGVQLADRDRVVAACVGDGSYMFANPVACHQVAEALNLPLLTIVMNNGVWNAVRRSTLEIFPDGHAARANLMPVTTLEPAPDFCMIAQASRAYAEAVEDPDELPKALQRALHVIRTEKRQVLLNVRTGTGAGEGR